MPGLLQTSPIMSFKFFLSSVLLMTSLLGDSFQVKKLFRLSVYFVRCLPLLLVPQISPLKIFFSSPSAPLLCAKTCGYLFLMVLGSDLLHLAISIISSLYFFSFHDIFIIRLVYISPASSLFSRFWSVLSIHNHAGEWTMILCRLPYQ